jgi:hypothetical protein
MIFCPFCTAAHTAGCETPNLSANSVWFEMGLSPVTSHVAGLNDARALASAFNVFDGQIQQNCNALNDCLKIISLIF